MSHTSHISSPVEFIDTKIRPNVEVQDWVGPVGSEERYSPNQLIGAYRAGYTSGIEAAFQAGQNWINQIRMENAERAGQHTRQILEWLLNEGFHPTRAILNQTEFDSPEVLIFLPVDEFASDHFDGLYSKLREYEEKVSEAQYRLRFMFTDDGPDIDSDLLAADGWLLYHTYLQKV
jgi:hypothetical protein